MTAARPPHDPDDDRLADADEDRPEHGPHRAPRTDESPTQRHTRQMSELLQETRVAAVGVQVLLGFLLSVPFSATLDDLQRTAYVVAVMAAMAATALLLAPSILHRALLHRGQAVWLVRTGSRLLLAGAAATSVALTASALLVGDRVLDGWVQYLPAAWTAAWVLVLWAVLPSLRSARLSAPD
ncbi:DUF6328 family protein [Patulibacter sp. SYSU D01012]|uniref:DUF6328 family protein n=1 Tax=Patulibacter sp. SYSU D01012 TaxID=2817381 RepID=UPI001B317A46|nr:DUF6328 family protein [Patulibacter sp. SYSU D01012]